MTTGLPPLPHGTKPEDRRAWELWASAVVDRVRRESSVECSDAETARGRVQGAQRMADLLLSGLAAPPVAE